LKNLFRKILPVKKPIKKDNHSLSSGLLEDYRIFASIDKTSPLCKAPFISMRFNRSGGVTPCCQNYHLTSIENSTLLEAWNSEAYQNLRQNILNNNLDGNCDFCKTLLLNRDFGNVLAANYEPFNISDKNYPVYLDFSIDSKCNLQCVMCNGSLSSGHQQKDESETKNEIYSESFLKQLEEIIPHLKYAIFSGGEPFMIDSYYKIWERMLALNPELSMVITTNATLISERAKSLIERGNFSFNVSIDSIDPAVYENIRVNASFQKTFSNLDYLIDYTKRKNTSLTLVVCPMIMNWKGIPDLIDFCSQKEIQIYFNLVTKPYEIAIWRMNADELKEVTKALQSVKISGQNSIQKYNASQLESLIHQTGTWAQQSDFYQKHLEAFLIEKTEFIEIISDHVRAAWESLNYSDEEMSVFNKKFNAIFDSLPAEFYCDFFLDRLLNMSPEKIYTEIKRENIATTNDNLCSIYYYARGEAYSRLKPKK
jgi:molybdenum cofactor biosynthesis enzyme MoaA